MLRSLLKQFTELRRPVRSLILLYYIYGFTGTLTGIFVQIKVYKMFPDLITNIVGAMFSFTGVMVGFCIFGYIVSHFRLDAKQGFYYSFLSFALGLVIISMVTTIPMAYLGLFVHGLGSGFFWLTVHTYELTETLDHERDFYSSVVEGGRQLIAIIAPLVASALIWVSLYVFHFSSFTILFIVAPCFYLLGLFSFKGIKEYRPERIEVADISHFLFDKKNRIGQIYFAGGGAQHILQGTLLPVVLFFILGTELRVGVYSIFAGIVSVVLIIILGHYRNRGNRMLLFGISALGIAFITTLLGYTLTFNMLVAFTIVSAVLVPIREISDHVVSLSTMENIGRAKRDFYATMILRDFSFWFWRMTAGLLAIFICHFFVDTHTRITVGLYVLAGAMIFSYFGARLLVSRMKIPATN